jgi:hypothetical protein
LQYPLADGYSGHGLISSGLGVTTLFYRDGFLKVAGYLLRIVIHPAPINLTPLAQKR